MTNLAIVAFENYEPSAYEKKIYEHVLSEIMKVSKEKFFLLYPENLRGFVEISLKKVGFKVNFFETTETKRSHDPDPMYPPGWGDGTYSEIKQYTEINWEGIYD